MCLEGKMDGDDRQENGSINFDGFAERWFQERNEGLARLAERPRERRAYERAMDRLFLNAERVNNKILTVINVGLQN